MNVMYRNIAAASDPDEEDDMEAVAEDEKE